MTNSTDETTTWTLTPDQLERAQERVDAVNKRATKRGFTGRLELHTEKTTRTTTNPAGLTVTEVVYNVQLTGTPPSYDGWTLLATLKWDEHAGLIVHTSPGVDTINRDGLRENWCDHCHTTRPRNSTYL